MEHAHTPLRIWTSVWLLSTLTALTACGGGGTESVTQGELTAQTLALPAPHSAPPTNSSAAVNGWANAFSLTPICPSHGARHA